jgi:8-oxo-dGTP diphosphatase
MFVVNVEGAIHRNGKWLLIRRSEKEEHAGGMLH